MNHGMLLYSSESFLSPLNSGYSPGGSRLAGFSSANSGGECLQGFKMAFYVESTGSG